MIKLVRYSYTGFEPQYQSYMYRRMLYVRNFKVEDLPKEITPYAAEIIINEVERKRPLIDDNFDYWGVHVFFDPVADGVKKMFLNHLDDVPPEHVLEVPETLLVYRLDEPWCSYPSLLREIRSDIGIYISRSSMNSVFKEISQ